MKFIVEKTKTGFSAFSEDLPIFTTGSTIPELLANAREATAVYFEGSENPMKAQKVDATVEMSKNS